VKAVPKRKSLAIVHPGMGRGGSEAAVMWGTQTLKEEFTVSIVTTMPVNLAALNEFYGTSIEANEIIVRKLPAPALLTRRRGRRSART
jgi:hypothetical protein